MNFFDRLKAQVNMNDGGKTFSKPSANPDASQMPRGMQMQQRAINHGPEMYDNPDFPTGGAPMPPNRRGGPGLQMGQSSPYGQQNIGPAVSFGGMQRGQFEYEDDLMPSDAIMGDSPYFTPQQTKYGYQQQGSFGENQQGTGVGDIQRIRKLLGY